MRIVFMGTPDFAATILEDLIQQHEVVAVYTRPDAVRGRGKKLTPSPVKRIAEQFGVPVYTPHTLRDRMVQQEIASFVPDVICVAAYGALLPPDILGIPRYGCLNVHASLLPRWRGAAPVERAILAGDTETGVCVMRMEEGLDTGDYCVCRTARIDNKNAALLTDELANLGSHALLTALVHKENDALDWTMQDDSVATYAPKIEKHELNLAPSFSACELLRKVKASSSAHPSQCCIAGRTVQVLDACIAKKEDACYPSDLEQGMARFSQKHLFLSCKEGVLEVLSLKPSGKQAMDATSFAVGVAALRQGDTSWAENNGA